LNAFASVDSINGVVWREARRSRHILVDVRGETGALERVQAGGRQLERKKRQGVVPVEHAVRVGRQRREHGVSRSLISAFCAERPAASSVSSGSSRICSSTIARTDPARDAIARRRVNESLDAT
jgi:hypothetical protein